MPHLEAQKTGSYVLARLHPQVTDHREEYGAHALERLAVVGDVSRRDKPRLCTCATHHGGAQGKADGKDWHSREGTNSQAYHHDRKHADDTGHPTSRENGKEHGKCDGERNEPAEIAQTRPACKPAGAQILLGSHQPHLAIYSVTVVHTITPTRGATKANTLHFL